MPEAFDSEMTNVMSRALIQALDRLRDQGMVDGDARAASSMLARLLLEAAAAGARDEESLVSFAVSRYAAEKGASGGG